jgi:hypothetical protein
LFDFCDAMFYQFDGYRVTMVVACAAFVVVNAWGALYFIAGQTAPRPFWYIVVVVLSALLLIGYAVHDLWDALHYRFIGWRPVVASAVIANGGIGLLVALTTGLLF